MSNKYLNHKSIIYLLIHSSIASFRVKWKAEKIDNNDLLEFCKHRLHYKKPQLEFLSGNIFKDASMRLRHFDFFSAALKSKFSSSFEFIDILNGSQNTSTLKKFEMSAKMSCHDILRLLLSLVSTWNTQIELCAKNNKLLIKIFFYCIIRRN